MRKTFTLLVLTLSFFACKRNTGSIRLESPDNSYTFNLKVEDIVSYSVSWKGQSLIENSALGFLLSDGSVLPGEVIVDKVERHSKNVDWRPVYGERNIYTDNYNEVLVDLSGKTFEGSSCT